MQIGGRDELYCSRDKTRRSIYPLALPFTPPVPCIYKYTWERKRLSPTPNLFYVFAKYPQIALQWLCCKLFVFRTHIEVAFVYLQSTELKAVEEDRNCLVRINFFY